MVASLHTWCKQDFPRPPFFFENKIYFFSGICVSIVRLWLIRERNLNGRRLTFSCHFILRGLRLISQISWDGRSDYSFHFYTIIGINSMNVINITHAYSVQCLLIRVREVLS